MNIPLIPVQPGSIPPNANPRKNGSDPAHLLAKLEHGLHEHPQSENASHCEGERSNRKIEVQPHEFRTLATQVEGLLIANQDFSLRIQDLEARMQAIGVEGEAAGGKLPNRKQVSQGEALPLEQEKNGVIKTDHPISADDSESQLSEVQFERRRNDELSAALSQLSGEIGALSHKFAREQKARQQAEAALAQFKGQFGQPTPTAPLVSEPSPPPAGNSSTETSPSRIIASSGVSNLATPGTGVVSDKIGKSLALMRRSLPYFVRHTGQIGLLNELCEQIGVLTAETAKTGILPLHQIGTALQIVLQEFHKTPSLLKLPRLRTVGQALDLMFVLSESENFAKLKGLVSTRILAVDDDGDVLAIVATLLESLALNVHSIKDSNQVIPVLEQEKFDLVVLDIGMPKQSGLELCARMRKLDGYGRTPVIFLTGMTAAQLRAQSALAGGDDFVSKPFHAAELGLKSIYWAFKGRMTA